MHLPPALKSNSNVPQWHAAAVEDNLSQALFTYKHVYRIEADVSIIASVLSA